MSAGYIHHVMIGTKPVRAWRTACGQSVLIVEAHSTRQADVTCAICKLTIANANRFRSLGDQGRNAGDAVPLDDDSHHGLTALQECTP